MAEALPSYKYEAIAKTWEPEEPQCKRHSL
jgi:hypothetical protein